jgi:Ca2+-binding RTX toxin-like protein
LAFTTIPGASATDATSFIGTEGVDTLNSFTTLTALVEGKESNDEITASLSGVAGGQSLTEWTVRGGTGLDNIDLIGSVVGGLFNGNQGRDVITADDVFGGARILGGQDNDSITVSGNLASSSANGNKGNDNVVVGNIATPEVNTTQVLNASVFGGQGDDVMAVAARVFESALISGDLGNDKIQAWFNGDGIVNGLTINGGDGDDIIETRNGGFADVGNGSGAGVYIDGGVGIDTLIASGRNDTIIGGEGADTVYGKGGIDMIDGGAGLTTVVGDGDQNTAKTEVDEIIGYVDGSTGNSNYAFRMTTAGVAQGGVFETLKSALENTYAVNGTQNFNVGVGLSTGSYTSYLINTDADGVAIGGYKLNGGYDASGAQGAVLAGQVTAVTPADIDILNGVTAIV